MCPVVRALTIGTAAALIGLPLISWFYFLRHMVPDGHTDFRANYAAGYMLRTGQPFYDYGAEVQIQNRVVSRESIALPFIHPAYEALLYAPLSYMRYLTAYWAWFAINLGLLAAIFWLLRDELSPLSVVAPWLPVGSFAAFIPFGTALVQGQDSLLLSLLLSSAFALLQKSERMFLAGMCLGLACFRFQIVVPIVICFLLWQRWPLIFGFVTAAMPEAFVSIAIGGFWPYVHRLQSLTMATDLQQPVSKMPNIRGLICALGGGTFLIATLSLALLLLVGRVGKTRHLRDQFAIAITAAALVSYHILLHDLSVLIIPSALLIARKTRTDLLIAGLAFCSPALMIFAPSHFFLVAIAVIMQLLYLLLVWACPSETSSMESGINFGKLTASHSVAYQLVANQCARSNSLK